MKKVNQFFNIEEVEAVISMPLTSSHWYVSKKPGKNSRVGVTHVDGVRLPSSLYIALYITGNIIASWYIVVELLSITNTWFVLGSSMVVFTFAVIDS
ncbi:hypothetical protein O9929_16995 [Vibrio lentus]|nr:hypothetical protein [Vibrio lentus]